MQYVLKDKVFPEIGAWADELAQIMRILSSGLKRSARWRFSRKSSTPGA